MEPSKLAHVGALLVRQEVRCILGEDSSVIDVDK
jgi:hypothetical protein